MSIDTNTIIGELTVRASAHVDQLWVVPTEYGHTLSEESVGNADNHTVIHSIRFVAPTAPGTWRPGTSGGTTTRASRGRPGPRSTESTSSTSSRRRGWVAERAASEKGPKRGWFARLLGR